MNTGNSAMNELLTIFSSLDAESVEAAQTSSEKVSEQYSVEEGPQLNMIDYDNLA